MRRRNAGFTLVEVIVAFAIVSLVLTALYQAIAGAYRGYARVQVREQTLPLARAQLDAHVDPDRAFFGEPSKLRFVSSFVPQGQ